MHLCAPQIVNVKVAVVTDGVNDQGTREPTLSYRTRRILSAVVFLGPFSSTGRLLCERVDWKSALMWKAGLVAASEAACLMCGGVLNLRRD